MAGAHAPLANSANKASTAAEEADSALIADPAMPPAQTSTHWLDQLGLWLFAAAIACSLALVKLAVGPLPVRTILLVGSGAALVLPDSARLGRAIAATRRILLVVAAAAVLALLVSWLAGNPMAAVMRQLLEIHLQAMIGVVIAQMIIARFGPVPLLLCFLAAFAMSGAVALAQWAGIDPAWQLRATIGRITGDPPLTALVYQRRERAMGLAFQPALFATHACLALIAIGIYRIATRGVLATRFDPWIIVGSIGIAILCLATGNRSPLLGIAIFLGLYLLWRTPRLVMIALPLALAGAVAAGPVLDRLAESGLRAAQRDDSSSEGRATLRRFGVYLISERPMGYGLTFDSTDHWQKFARASRYRDNPNAIRQWALHNYYLNIIAKHGVLLLLLIPFVLPWSRGGRAVALFYIPYFIHIFYHNDGPLQGDFLFFLILPAALHMAAHSHHWLPEAGGGPVARRSWRRAFAEPSPTSTASSRLGPRRAFRQHPDA